MDGYLSVRYEFIIVRGVSLLSSQCLNRLAADSKIENNTAFNKWGCKVMSAARARTGPSEG